jgi:restriction system protein
MFRGGWEGEREAKALKEGLVIAGWPALGDLRPYRTREKLRDAVQRAYPDASNNTVGNWTGQLWRLLEQMQPGDLVVMPLKTHQGHVAIGRVTGPYEYREDQPQDFRHTRKVRWIRTDVARDAIRPDLRASLGSLLTVCGLTRHDGARRIAHLADRGVDPGADGDEKVTTSEELLEDAASRDPADPRRLTIRSFLEHWGGERRTGAVVAMIKSDLADKGLTTRPPFTEGAVGDEIELVPVGAEPSVGADVTHLAHDAEDVSGLDPVTLRIGSLPPASLVSVLNTVTLTHAKTVMLRQHFSQLAVTDQTGRYQGAVSWESIGKAHIANANPSLADATVPAVVVDHDARLLEQIDVIYSNDFIFVYNADRSKVTGIVTAADLTRQFGSLARPFVLIEEAENRLRRRSGEVFTVDELREAVRPPARSRVNRVADLTFGNYGYLLEPEDRWAKLSWNIDRKLFLELLEEVRKIRNELMHFTPDPLSQKQYDAVEGLLELLRTVDPRP